MTRRDSLWVLVWFLLIIFVAVDVALGLRHWNTDRSTPANMTSYQFGTFPSNPSSIVITKYTDPNSDVQRQSVAYTLTGEKMQLLYEALIQDAQTVVDSNMPYSCPAYTNMIVWDYRLVVRYPNHTDRTFMQRAGTGCVTVTDEQTGASAKKAAVTTGLPGLTPFEPISK